MFPIFIPSKSRSNTCTTAQLLKKYGLPFTLFIYNDDYDDYLLKFHKDNLSWIMLEVITMNGSS